METKTQPIIFNKSFDLIFIKFPIVFPILYGIFLFSFPSYENILIFVALLIFAEPHFGATWPLFLNKENFSEIKSKKIRYIYMPLLIIFLCLAGFFYANALFLLIFFAVNMFHVTRQSYGICKLYKNSENELFYQEKVIYLTNIIFFTIGILRFYIPIINEDNIFIINMFILFSLLTIFLIYFLKFKNTENFLTFVTGCIIFYPICFVDKPIHGIVMGVLMHYTQYISLTYKVYNGRNLKKLEKQVDNIKLFSAKNLYFLMVILFYGFVMAVLSTFSSFGYETLKYLIVVPLTGQFLHFYLDAFLWKFSEKHNRDNTLKHLYN